VLDSARDHEVSGPGGDQRRREGDRLLPRAALTVDGGGRNGLGQAGLQPGVAADVDRLLPIGEHPADDRVVDSLRIGAGPLEQLGQAGGEQLVRVQVPELALGRVAASDPGPAASTTTTS
jgi:hypothetical protein